MNQPRLSRGLTTAAVLGVSCIAALPARAQYGGVGGLQSGVDTGPALSAPSGALGGGGLLPVVGFDPRMGDLRPQLEAYYARNSLGPPSTTPAWLVSPSLGVNAGFTDNVYKTSSPRRADVFSTIQPAIVVSHDAPRLTLNASYAPSYTVYAQTQSQNRFSQFGDLRALLTVVPETVFIDARASASQSSLFGNGLNGAYNQTSYNQQNDVQTYTYSVTPYAQQRFGGYGTGRVGYSIARTVQDYNDSNLDQLTSTNAFGTNPYGTIGNLTTQRERASFSTGENFGRFNDLTYIQGTQYSGSGSYRNAHRNEALSELGYAITRNITILGGIGYQDLFYNGLPPYRINEPTFNGGARYNPNPDTSITVLYGRRDGATNVSFDGSYAPTARTRILARYSTGITSDVEEAQNTLDTTSLGPTGLVTDSVTGAPVGSGVGGVQNGIYRVRRLSATGLLLQDRNSYSIAVTQEDRTTLTNTTSLFTSQVVPAGTSSNSVYVSGSWQHDLAPNMSTNVQAQYGVTNSTAQLLTGVGGNNGGQQRTFTLSASLNRQFTETLTGYVSYVFTDQIGTSALNNTAFNSVLGRSFNTGSYTDNTIFVGLRKSF